jgi:hypothetical protein
MMTLAEARADAADLGVTSVWLGELMPLPDGSAYENVFMQNLSMRWARITDIHTREGRPVPCHGAPICVRRNPDHAAEDSLRPAERLRILERHRIRRFIAPRRRSSGRPRRRLTGQALGLVVMTSAQAGPAWVWRSIQRPISIWRSDADRHLWAGKSTRGFRSAAAGRR